MPTYAGHPACSCQVAWLPVFIEAATRLKILTPSNPLVICQLIGTAPESAETHRSGGAADWANLQPRLVALAREMGADATWIRRRSQGFDMDHTHSVLRGCPHGASHNGYQVVAVDNGQNGLASCAPDDGPRPLSGRTWREGIAWANQNIIEKGPFMALTDRQQDDLYRWVKEIVTDTREISTTSQLARRVLPGQKSIGRQGDLWPAVWAAVTRKPKASAIDEKKLAKSIVDAIPDDLAASVAEELARRLTGAPQS